MKVKNIIGEYERVYIPVRFRTSTYCNIEKYAFP